MLDIVTNKLYIKLIYIFISFSFATVISDLPFFNLINKVVLLIAFMYVAINFIEIILRRRKPYIFEIFLYLFLLLTLTLTLTQYKATENLKVWLVNLMILTVLFSIDLHKPKLKLQKELNIISYFYVFLSSITSIVSLIMIFANKVITKDMGELNGVKIILNYKGLFKNENSFGIAAVLCLLITLYLIKVSRNKSMKTILSINVIIELIAVLISGARSAFFPLLTLVLVFLIFKYKNTIVRLSLFLVPSLVSITAFFTLPSDILHKILTSREYLWLTAIRLLKVYPLVGVGSVNKVGRLQDHRVDYLQGVGSGGLHNIFFEISVINGIPATIIFITFIILVSIFCIRKMDKMNISDQYKFGVLFSLFLGIVFINLLESSLLYIISFISIIFWIYLGYLVALLTKNEE